MYAQSLLLLIVIVIPLTLDPGLDVKFKKSRTNNNMTGITFFFTVSAQVEQISFIIVQMMIIYIIQ